MATHHAHATGVQFTYVEFVEHYGEEKAEAGAGHGGAALPFRSRVDQKWLVGGPVKLKLENRHEATTPHSEIDILSYLSHTQTDRDKKGSVCRLRTAVQQRRLGRVPRFIGAYSSSPVNCAFVSGCEGPRHRGIA